MKNDVKKLACRILFILGAFLLFWLHFVFKEPLNYVDQDAAYCIWMKNFAGSRHSSPCRVLFLGDSLSNCAFLPNFLPGNVASVCLGGATPIPEYYILRRYLENNDPPRVCYLGFADQSLGASDTFLTTATARLFTFPEVLEVTAEGKKVGQKFTASPPYPAWEFYCLSPRIYQLSLMRGFLAQRKESNGGCLHHADIHAGAYLQPVSGPFGTGELCKDHFSVTPVIDVYYRRMIELCRSKGIQVKIVKLPSNPAVSHTENYRKEFSEYYRKLMADYPGITVDWFEYGLDEDCFVDTIGHMNLKGGCLFSKMLARYYPEDFDEGIPLSDSLEAGLAEYRQTGFDPDQLEPSAVLANILEQ